MPASDAADAIRVWGQRDHVHSRQDGRDAVESGITRVLGQVEGLCCVKSEAHRYLELPAAPMNTDPLEWWAANEINFPALSVMARQYLGVPATSASAERLFSLAGRAFDDLRQCMKEEMLEILMWARINKEKRQRD